MSRGRLDRLQPEAQTTDHVYVLTRLWGRVLVARQPPAGGHRRSRFASDRGPDLFNIGTKPALIVVAGWLLVNLVMWLAFRVSPKDLVYFIPWALYFGPVYWFLSPRMEPTPKDDETAPESASHR